MELCSLTFLYLLLPLSLFACLVTPVRHRAALLFLLSCLFYYQTQGGLWLCLLLGTLSLDWFLAGIMRGQAALRSALMITAAAKSIFLFVFLNILKKLDIIAHIPLGFGVFSLISLGFVLDCYNQYCTWEPNPIPFALSCTFYPQLYAGPIVHYGRMSIQFRRPRMTLEKIGEGCGVFLRGMGKKLLLGDAMGTIAQTLQGQPAYALSSAGVWVMAFTLAMALYFILSGYCDMARGLAFMFGFELPENFHDPFLSKSINEFFGRFNCTVNRFIRRHVYLTLGGAEGKGSSVIFNVLLLSILMALWFGLRFNLVLWGAVLAGFVLLERVVSRRVQVPAFFRWLFCTAAILVSMAFFAGDSISDSFFYLRAMFFFGPGGQEAEQQVAYLLLSNYLALLLTLFCAFGIPKAAAAFVRRKVPRCMAVLENLGSLALLLLLTAYLV